MCARSKWYMSVRFAILLAGWSRYCIATALHLTVTVLYCKLPVGNNANTVVRKQVINTFWKFWSNFSRSEQAAQSSPHGMTLKHHITGPADRYVNVTVPATTPGLTLFLTHVQFYPLAASHESQNCSYYMHPCAAVELGLLSTHLNQTTSITWQNLIVKNSLHTER